MHTLTTFRWVPPFAAGHVCDLRVRWALEQAQLPYKLRLIGPKDQQTASYRQQQPFELRLLDNSGLVDRFASLRA